MPGRFHFAVVLILVVVPAAKANFTLLDEGYRQMFNLQFNVAHGSFEDWRRLHPEDPMGPVSDAAAYLFAEFDRLHILQSEFFTNDRKFLDRQSPAPDPAVKQKFENALAETQKLAERVDARSPGEENAMFASILRFGLHANYLALIEKRYMASLREAKNARVLAEELLARDPKFYDAYLAIGTENYLLGLKPAPLRWMLRIGGAQTDKDLGIAKLRLTAEKGRYMLPYARLLLAVAALRDKNRPRAKELLKGLARDFPGNRLYAQELARLP